MTCFDVRGTLSALIDGAATSELKGAALRHMDACADCRAELEVLVGTDRIVKQGAMLAAAAAPPAGYFDDLVSRIDRRIAEEGPMPDRLQGEADTNMPVPPAPPPRQEISGLHDIRQLARSTLERKAEAAPEDADLGEALLASSSHGALGRVVLPDPQREVAPSAPAAAVARPSIASVAMPPPKKGSMWPFMAVASTLVAGAAAVYLFVYPGIMNQQPSDDANEPAGAVAQRENAQLDQGYVATPLEAPVTTAAPAVAPPPESPPPPPGAAPVAAIDEEERGRSREKAEREKGEKADRNEKDKEKKEREAGAKLEKPEEREKEAQDPPKPAPASGQEGGLDSLLNEAAKGGEKTGGDTKPSGEVAPGVPEGGGATDEELLPETLSASDIRKGMGGVRARVQACYDKYKVAGTVSIKVRIERDGHVASADAVDGKFAATETGLCVSQAVEKATFAKFRGAPITLNYPFKLQ